MISENFIALSNYIPLNIWSEIQRRVVAFGLAWELRKPRSYAEVYNDLDGIMVVDYCEGFDGPKTVWHLADKPPVDPLVAASECAISQPKQEDWRTWRRMTFRPAQVSAIIEEETEFTVEFANKMTHAFVNAKNFNNSGGTACDWFKEHVMGITSNRPAQP